MRHIYEQLRKEGHIHRGTIGVVAQDIDPVMSCAPGLNVIPDSLADVLPHSSAEAAGLQQGDVVLAIEGRPVTEPRQVQAEVVQRAIGDTITLDILRDGEKMQKTAAILERPKSPLALADLSIANPTKELGILAITLDESRGAEPSRRAGWMAW